MMNIKLTPLVSFLIVISPSRISLTLRSDCSVQHEAEHASSLLHRHSVVHPPHTHGDGMLQLRYFSLFVSAAASQNRTGVC